MYLTINEYLITKFQIENITNKQDNYSVLKIISPQDLQKFADKNKYFNSIPKIVHYIYKSNYIPNQYITFVQHCIKINKNAKFIFWSDFAVYQLILNEFPSFIEIYNSYFSKSTESLKISDVSRYLILLKFGGIYMDLDTRCQKPMENIPINSSCFLSRETEESSRILYNLEYVAMNSLMACIPEHRFFEQFVKQLTKADSTHILHQTGPLKLRKFYMTYNSSLSENERKDVKRYIIVSKSSLFSPFIEKYVESKCNGKIQGNWKIKGCKDFAEYKKNQDKLINDAIVVHLFMHLGYDYAKGRIKNLTHITDLNINISVMWP